MKTLIRILLLSVLSSFLLAQTDSTDSDSLESVVEEPIVEVADSLETELDTDELMVSDSTEADSSSYEMVELDSATTDTSMITLEDEVEVVEPEMEWVQNDPAPVNVAGLMVQGPIYFWSNDGLEGLGLESLPYVSILDPTMIAIKANDCMDIVCHLLASDSSGVNYVVVIPDDNSPVRIYNTITKVVSIEAPMDSIAMAFDGYLKDLAGTEYLVVQTEEPPVMGPELPVDLDASALALARAKTMEIRNRQFRSFDELSRNPANLGRKFDNKVSLNLLPNFNVSVHNSLLTPGWYTDWVTVGGVWDEDMKSDFLATVMDQNLAINVSPDFSNFIGFRIGGFGLNIGFKSHVKMVLPGNLIGLGMQDILLNEPIENGGFELESVPLMSKTSLSYGRSVYTPFGDIIVGLGLNTYKGLAYMKTVSDDLTISMTEDSIFVTSSGESWVTEGGIEGHADDPNFDSFDALSTGSDLAIGFDIGAIMDLHDYLNQEVEVQVSLKNLGAKYTYTGITHQSFSYRMAMPAPGNIDSDSTEQYETTDNVVLGTDETLEVDIPAVFNLAAYYQPLAKIGVGIGIEKAFTDEAKFGYSPDLEINYQLNLYAAKWLDFSYYRQAQYGDPVHTFGSGLHFGFLDTGFTLSFLNGLNTDAKGIGVGLRSSLHF